MVPITTRENVDAIPTVEGVHRCPGLLGGMEWNGPAYDPGSNTLFVPAVDWCGIFSKAPKDPPIMQGMHYYGGAVASDPREKSKGWLTAFDASTGKERWKYASPTPLVAGVTATSGGVLFTGDLNNDFLALGCQDRRRALPLQHRRQHRRRRDLLCARRQAICRDHVRNRVGLLWRLGAAGGRRLRRG